MDDLKTDFVNNCISIDNLRKNTYSKKNMKKENLQTMTQEDLTYIRLVWTTFLLCQQYKINLLSAIINYFDILQTKRLENMRTVHTVINLDFMSNNNIEFQKKVCDFNDLLKLKTCNLNEYSKVVQSVIENENLISVISQWVCERNLKDNWTFDQTLECNDEMVAMAQHLIKHLHWDVGQIEFNNNNQPIVGMIPLKYSDMLKFWQNRDIAIHKQFKEWCDNNPNYKMYDQIIDSCEIQISTKTNNPHFHMNECVNFMNKVEEILITNKNHSFKDINQFLKNYMQIYNQFSFLKSQDWINFMDCHLKEHNHSIYILGAPTIFNDINKLNNLIEQDITKKKYIKIRFLPYIPTMLGEYIYSLLQNDTLIETNRTKFNKAWQLCINFLKCKYQKNDWNDKSRGHYLSDQGLLRKHITFKSAFQSLMMNHLHLFKELKWIKVILFFLKFCVHL